MKNLLAALAVCLVFATVSADADAARRFGGGSNLGKRPVPTFNQKAAPNAVPQTPAGQMRGQNAQPNRAAQAPQTPVQKPSMMRSVLTGLAAALGISALLSLLGINGAGMVSLVMGLLLAAAAFMAFRFFMARRGVARTADAPGGPGASASDTPEAAERRGEARTAEPVFSSSDGSRAGSVMDQFMGSEVVSQEANVIDVTPVDFDRAGFLKTARENYVLLQKAWDTGNVVEISDFTTEDVFIAITHQLHARGKEVYKTEVLELDNELLGIAREGSEYQASVRFTGRLTINGEEERVDETWLLVKPTEGPGGWLLGGIKQNDADA